MKRVSLFLIAMFLFAGVGLKSQTPASTGAVINYTGYENKLKKSDSDIQDPKKNIKTKTWTSRAQLLIDIFNINNDVLRVGMDQASAKLFYKEPTEVQTKQEGGDKIEIFVYDRINLKFRNGALESWTETKKIHADPLTEARKAVDEALKLNTDGKANDDIIAAINKLKIAYETDAVSAYERKEFQNSYDGFMKLLDLNKVPLMNNKIDTVDIYFAARAALENKDYKEATRLFELAATYNYNDPYLYVFRKQALFAVGDTATGVKVINEGFNKFPTNQSIMIEMINYYLVTNQSDEALRLLAVAKANDPGNVSYTFAEGSLYDKMGKFDEAEKAYKACIEQQPDFYNGYYNLGVIYFNKAVKIYEDASRISDNTEFEKMQVQGDEMLKSAIPYMQKASQIDPADRYSLETLKTIYYRLKMDTEYQDVVSKLNAL
jgi:tetratricopeptide (TPR) repeat protein